VSNSRDRSIKLAQYRTIKSLRYYLLVAQNKTSVEVYGRLSEDAVFTYEVYESLEQNILLPALDAVLPMSEVYKYIEFVEEV
jgi:Uma2 family endonuclease